MIIVTFIKYVESIFNNEKRPFSLFYNFFKGSFFLIISKFFKITKIRLNNFIIHFPDYNLFFQIYCALFINKEYMFKSDKHNPVIIDCGANIGLATLFFKKYYPNSSIICFEPDPVTFKILENNLSKNKIKNLNLNNFALGLKKENINFYVDKNIKSSPGMSIHNRLEKQGNCVEIIKVKVVKLSEYINSEIDLVKIDVEGNELSILRDLDKNKKLRYVKEIILEYHSNIENNNLSNIFKILEKNGYSYEIYSSTKTPFVKEKNYNFLIHSYK